MQRHFTVSLLAEVMRCSLCSGGVPWWCIVSESLVRPSERPGLRVSSPHPENIKYRRLVLLPHFHKQTPQNQQTQMQRNNSMTCCAFNNNKYTCSAQRCSYFRRAVKRQTAFLFSVDRNTWHLNVCLCKHSKMSESICITLPCHMLYRLCLVGRGRRI